MTFDKNTSYLVIGGPKDGERVYARLPRFAARVPKTTDNPMGIVWYTWRKMWHARADYGFFLLDGEDPRKLIHVLMDGYRKVRVAE